MGVGEWSGSGSGRLISDVPRTDVLRSLDVIAVLIINYWKWTQSYKIENERIREEKLFAQLQGTTQY
jgi:hypothetical protein